MAFAFAAGDETGDTGFVFDGGSTSYFVVTIVLANDPQEIRASLHEVQQTLGLSQAVEFKFHDTSHRSREIFLAGSQKASFFIRSLYVNKRRLPVYFRLMKNLDFYGFFFSYLLDRLPTGELDNTVLTLDEFGPLRLSLRSVREPLRQIGLWGKKNPAVKRILFRRSQSEPMIQVADMCGGAIYHWLTTGDDKYYRLIRNRTLVWEYRSPQ